MAVNEDLSMDEADWLNSTDPQAMFAFLRDRDTLTDRKARLFAVACCRRIWHLLSDETSKRPVEVAERFLDGGVDAEELTSVWESAASALVDAQEVGTDTACAAVWAAAEDACIAAASASSHAASCVKDAAWTTAIWDAGQLAQATAAWQAAWAVKWHELAAQAAILRDIFGHSPFRLVTFPPSVRTWNGGLIQRLAQAAYENRLLPAGHLDPEQLAVLADAMEEAGADAEMVAHLRGPGPHVRGCHVVDLLTGRE